MDQTVITKRAFTLIELMMVVVIIMVMMGLTALTFSASRPAVKVKRDASRMVAFMRNMWDHTRTTSAPLILIPDFETGALSYEDPRTGKTAAANFASKAHIIGIKINDRLYSAASMPPPPEEQDGDEAVIEDEMYDDGGYDGSIFLSEGRGLTSLAVIFGVPKDKKDKTEGYEHLTMCTLNLITGKGEIRLLDEEELNSLLAEAEEEALEEELDEPL